MRRIAISSEGPGLDDAVDPRYGRAGGFVVAEYSEGGEAKLTYLDNGASQLMPQGAGIATTEMLAGAGIDAVLSGYVGPKAFEALLAAGIDVVQDMEGMTVREALERYRSGQCLTASAPNHEAGM